MNIYYSNEFTAHMQAQSTERARDLMSFMSYLVSETSFTFNKKDNFNIQSYTWKPDPQYDKMKIVEIAFQCWGNKESGLGEKYKWVNRRAIDFSCGNQVFEKILWTVDELEKAGVIK